GCVLNQGALRVEDVLPGLLAKLVVAPVGRRHVGHRNLHLGGHLGVAKGVRGGGSDDAADVGDVRAGNGLTGAVVGVLVGLGAVVDGTGLVVQVEGGRNRVA